ncbi:MAG: hypothetical protein NC343_03680 [Muribaculum sp.]|nr:hypothetical protein [Muribaculaceae bacterium]MCM1080829.1 hypothetical protein [Muribaculum sp.]
MNKIAKITSWILSPLLIPTYGTAMALWLTVYNTLSPGIIWRVVAMVWAITCLVPVIAILIMWRMHVVADPGLNNRTERSIPYLLTIVCYIIAVFYLRFIHAPYWMWMFFVAGACAAVVSLVVNLRWKISAHMAATGGLVAMSFRIASLQVAVVDMWPVITCLVLLAGLLGSSRILLRCHTLAQVLAGTANGFFWVWLLT